MWWLRNLTIRATILTKTCEINLQKRWLQLTTVAESPTNLGTGPNTHRKTTLPYKVLNYSRGDRQTRPSLDRQRGCMPTHSQKFILVPTYILAEHSFVFSFPFAVAHRRGLCTHSFLWSTEVFRTPLLSAFVWLTLYTENEHIWF